MFRKETVLELQQERVRSVFIFFNAILRLFWEFFSIGVSKSE